MAMGHEIDGHALSTAQSRLLADSGAGAGEPIGQYMCDEEQLAVQSVRTESAILAAFTESPFFSDALEIGTGWFPARSMAWQAVSIVAHT